MRLWRISNYADLSGRGGMVSAGRWNFSNTPLVYCADHPATALLEILVHVDAEDMPKDYQLLEIELPDSTAILVPDLPQNWKDDVMLTRRLGTDFIVVGTHAAMEVPCVIVPFTKNYLLNPGLLMREGIAVVGVTKHPIDTRLLE
jgi:RES domain-containing protein